MKVAFVRGSYLNNFEGQNFVFHENKVELTGICSKHSIHQEFPFEVIRLPSITDLPINQQLIKIMSNRIIGDSHMLFGLEKYASYFDVFHTADTHYYYSYQLARLRKQQRIKKLVASCWETIPHNNETVLAKKKLKEFTKKYIDVFVCYTNRAKECLVQEGVNGNKIRVIPIGVNINRFYPKRAPKNDEIILLYVGRLVPEKGIMDIVTIFCQLKKESAHRIKLRIIGQGVLQKEIEDKIKLEKMTDCIEIISCSYESIHKQYQDADIFLSASFTTKTWEEQYGMVLIEAMASGLPVVVYGSGAIPEIVGNAAYLILEKDKIQYKKAVQDLIKNEINRKKIGTIGRDRAVSHFDAKKSAQSFYSLYTSL